MPWWPTLSDYQEAIQNPKSCFSDPELRSGIPTTDKLGLPKPVTGGFASVYEMKCGGRKFAVRCFLRHIADIEQRYSIISNHLKQSRLQFMVDFKFINRGIMIRGQWFPILKMEWIDGFQLNTYIEKNLQNPQAFQSLAGQFSQLVTDLKRNSIAHGDLQHGNILVLNGNMRLIDYDGMYVPGLEGMPSHELGHKNYQHPNRTEKDFGPDLDNFSAWVIYSSLAILTMDPATWKVAGPDESLLFHHSDFIKPSSSRILNILEKNSENRIRSLASSLRSIFRIPVPRQVPQLKPLNNLSVATTYSAPKPIPTPSSISKPPVAQEPTPGPYDWLGDYALDSVRRLAIRLIVIFTLVMSIPIMAGLLCFHPQVFLGIALFATVLLIVWVGTRGQTQ